jgi:uncharacterized protein
MMSTRRWKASRYNHFVPTDDGNVLAFNALACGLAQMDRQSYETYQKVSNGEITDYSQIPTELFDKLKEGNFLIPDTRDEIRRIKANHYMARFSHRGLGLTIIPTLECNFACDYCYEPDNPDAARVSDRENMREEVQDSLARIAKSTLSQGTKLGVTWYGGEPLLALEVIESLTERLIRACEERQAEYRAAIITNGYLFTPEVSRRLMDLRVSSAQITIDGPEEVHNARRPLIGKGPTYRTITENLKKLPEDIPFTVSIRVNVDERNQAYIPSLLQDLKKLGLHDRKNISMYFGRVAAYSCACRDVIEHCMVTKEFAVRELEFYQEAMKLGFAIRSYPGNLIGSCGAVGTGGFVVEPDGTLQSCWTLVGRKDKRVGEMVGSTIQFNDNRDKWLSWSPFDKKGCVDCSILPLCMGGCPYECLFRTELPVQNKSTCAPWKYNLEEMMKFTHEANKLGLFIPPKRGIRPEMGENEKASEERR